MQTGVEVLQRKADSAYNTKSVGPSALNSESDHQLVQHQTHYALYKSEKAKGPSAVRSRGAQGAAHDYWQLWPRQAPMTFTP